MKKPSGIDKKIKGYQKRFKKYGDDPRALQWWSKKWAELRYKEIVADLDFKGPRPLGPMARRGKTILDVGCGFGDIIVHIEKKTKDIEYTGVDIVPEFIEVAKNKYPRHQFILRDYFENPLKKSFEIVISSGTLNANINSPMDYRKKAIKTIFGHASEAAAFNMAGSHPQPENKKGNRVYYADSLDILKFCITLTRKVILRHHYYKKDFTIVMFKK